jgi:endoglucanase
MSKRLPSIVFSIANFIVSAFAFVKADDLPHYPFPQHITYAAETIKPNHLSQAQLDDHVRAYYDHWKQQYLIRENDSPDKQILYRVSHGLSDAEKTVSEGQGYGMILAALMAGHDNHAHDIFDGLYRFFRQHPSGIDKRLMSWECSKNAVDKNSAFDGDADIAYGLLLADRQWGSQGQINYHDAAQDIIAGILESTIGADSHLPLLGDWVGAKINQPNQYASRSSDFMLAHFRAFGRFTGNSLWNQVVSESQAAIDVIQNQYSQKTGLLPDFIVDKKPALPHFLEGDNDGDFSANAGRVPLRLGMDVVLNNDPITRGEVKKMSAWVQAATNGNPNQIQPGYKLDGSGYSDYFFTAFYVAPFGVAAMSDPGQQVWLNAIYDTVYNKYKDYYDDSVNLLSLLVMTGNYWDPSTMK